jgi:alpha-beta hydrolase superfamily lysophospholipase
LNKLKSGETAMNAMVLKLAGRLFNTIGMISPEAGGRLAFALFTRTRNPKPATPKEQALFDQSASRMAEAARSVIAVPGGQAVVHHFPAIGPADGKRVLITHGWASRIAYTQGLVTALRQAGMEVYGLDLPGHGDAPGRKLNALMAIDAIAKTYRRYGPFDAMIGHSFGVYMTVLAAHGSLDGRPLDPRKLVVIAAPADVRVVLSNYSRLIGLREPVKKALIGQIERVTGKPAEAAFGPSFLNEGKIPTLILHAEEDKEVSAKAARAYSAAGPHVTLQWLNGLGHRRIVNSPDAIEAIKNFLGSEGG